MKYTSEEMNARETSIREALKAKLIAAGIDYTWWSVNADSPSRTYYSTRKYSGICRVAVRTASNGSKKMFISKADGTLDLDKIVAFIKEEEATKKATEKYEAEKRVARSTAGTIEEKLNAEFNTQKYYSPLKVTTWGKMVLTLEVNEDQAREILTLADKLGLIKRPG